MLIELFVIAVLVYGRRSWPCGEFSSCLEMMDFGGPQRITRGAMQYDWGGGAVAPPVCMLKKALLYFRWSWSSSGSCYFGLGLGSSGLGLGLVTLVVLILRIWFCLHHCLPGAPKIGSLIFAILFTTIQSCYTKFYTQVIPIQSSDRRTEGHRSSLHCAPPYAGQLWLLLASGNLPGCANI